MWPGIHLLKFKGVQWKLILTQLGMMGGGWGGMGGWGGGMGGGCM